MTDFEVRAPLSDAETAAALALVDTAERIEGRLHLDDQGRLDLTGGRPGLVGILARDRSSGALRAYAQLSGAQLSGAQLSGAQLSGAQLSGAQLSGSGGTWNLSYAVDPAQHDRTGALPVALIEAALDAVRARGGGEVHLWLHDPNTEDAEIARRAGFVAFRELLQLRRALPLGSELESTEPATTRPLRTGADEQALVTLNASAFADHPDQGSWTLADIEEREREDWFDPEDVLLLERDGELTGFCWTKLHRDEMPALGEIYVIAIAQAQRGHGLGRALLRAGLDHLHRRGLRVAMLYVDSDNTAARHLYESFGFGIDHADHAYRAEVHRR